MPSQGTSTSPPQSPKKVNGFHGSASSSQPASPSRLPPQPQSPAFSQSSSTQGGASLTTAAAAGTGAVAAAPQAPAPPEVESTLTRLSAHRNVRGVLILSRQGPIIRHSGGIFEGEQGRKYAAAVKRIVDCCKAGLDDIEEGDELRFLRMRTKRHELMISPDDKYLLVVLQDPSQ